MMENEKTQPTLLHASELEKTYDETGNLVRVLRGVDLTVQQGDMLGIVGQSGVGKTTLLYLLGSLETPTGGKVLYKGRDLFAMKNEQELANFRNRNIGFVFQFHHLIPEFTALENTMMPALLARHSKQKARQMALDAMKTLGVDHRTGHKPGELSGGEQQRVAVARAVVMRPDVVLADEPTGNLDIDTSERLHAELVRLNEEYGLTFIIVTHNEKFAQTLPRVVRLERGKLHDAKLTES